MYKCGYVAIIGRPNVGKSTLLNCILGQKISITTHKPQTTRHRIIGIKTSKTSQVVYVDTPGIHLGGKRAINRYMNKAATSAMKDVDIIVFVIERLKWTEEDEFVLTKIASLSVPVILVINKIDQIDDKQKLLPHLTKIAKKMEYYQVVPISARRGDAVADLEKMIGKLLPEAGAYYPDEQITDRTERFLASELIREKLIRKLGQELPYSLTVEIEQYSEKKDILHISAIIWVERVGQKAIIIGKQGDALKRVGALARRDMEQVFGQQVHLQLWVKVKKGWSNNERALRSLGYRDDS